MMGRETKASNKMSLSFTYEVPCFCGAALQETSPRPVVEGRRLLLQCGDKRATFTSQRAQRPNSVTIHLSGTTRFVSIGYAIDLDYELLGIEFHKCIGRESRW